MNLCDGAPGFAMQFCYIQTILHEHCGVASRFSLQKAAKMKIDIGSYGSTFFLDVSINC